ncbi:unnamed protein product [Prorocentrum cordatum]|uniref:ATP-grasp domain-containing protein n=1 Tax=Prorocentrum cordatum TaxID=2364126 RepID=A0ABN9TQ23_9DINO|nr:unnamed protein product [Polarella glacialis]
MVFVSADGSRMVALVVGSGYRSRHLCMFERMRELGMSTVVVVDEGSWAHEMEVTGVVHTVVVVPGLEKLPQEAELADAVVDALRAASVGNVTGAYNLINWYLPLTALVAERLGVVTNSYEAVRRCVFKNETRKCLVASGLESWKSFPCSKKQDIEQAARQIAFPAILKPARGSASIGVVKVLSAEEAVKTFLEQRAERNIQDEVFLLEEYIDGPEFGVEIIMQHGRHLFCSVMDADKQSHGQFFQGTGRSFPTVHGHVVEALVASHCVASVHALGLTTGVFDLDVRFSPRCGVRILEVNARMGGGSVQRMHKHVYGMDLVELHLQTCMGISVGHLADRHPLEPSVCYEAGWVESPYSGVVSGIGIDAFTERLRSMFRENPHVLEFVPFCDDGDAINGYKVPGLPTSLILVFTKGAEKSFAQQHLAGALRAAEERIADLVEPDASLAPRVTTSVDAVVTAAVGTAMLCTAAVLTHQMLVEQVMSPKRCNAQADCMSIQPLEPPEASVEQLPLHVPSSARPARAVVQ